MKHPTKRAIKWAKNLSVDDKLKIREFIMRIHILSEEWRINDATTK